MVAVANADAGLRALVDERDVDAARHSLAFLTDQTAELDALADAVQGMDRDVFAGRLACELARGWLDDYAALPGRIENARALAVQRFGAAFLPPPALAAPPPAPAAPAAVLPPPALLPAPPALAAPAAVAAPPPQRLPAPLNIQGACRPPTHVPAVARAPTAAASRRLVEQARREASTRSRSSATAPPTSTPTGGALPVAIAVVVATFYMALEALLRLRWPFLLFAALFVAPSGAVLPSVSGVPQRALKGHGHFVADVVISSDGQFALSGSWDKTLRLWDLNTGATTRRFVNHTKDVLNVAFSADNRQIVSGSRDKTIKLWNTLAQAKYTITEDCHSDWVSCVRFSPNNQNPIIVSAGWDKTVKVWNLANCKTNHLGHSAYINHVTVSPDGSLCASGGKDGNAMLWDLNEGKHLYTLDGTDVVNALTFSPNRYWLCAAVGPVIKVWEDCHSDWVSCVRFSPNNQNPIIVSAGWDKTVKVWNLANCKLKTNHLGHSAYINHVTVSPDGSLCASGGKDGNAMLWDLNEGKHLYTLDGTDMVNALTFSPNRYWLCAAVGPVIKVWDLEDKRVVDELKPDIVGGASKPSPPPQCTALCWSSDGQTLYAGYSDNMIRVWQVSLARP